MEALDYRINATREKINLLLASQSSKKYSLNPPISEREVVKIEQDYQITLPLEYRAFLTKIGNGGYGLLSIERSLQCLYNEISEDKIDNGYLKIPFIHTSAYNPFHDPYLIEMSDKCDRGEISETEFSSVYVSFYQYSTTGTLTISLEGCAYSSFLVITGPTRGQVWFNADAGSGGYIPSNLSFLGWYERWLDEYFQ